MTKFLLKNITFRELEAWIPEQPAILLPLGSQEERGPTSPMGEEPS